MTVCEPCVRLCTCTAPADAEASRVASFDSASDAMGALWVSNVLESDDYTSSGLLVPRLRELRLSRVRVGCAHPWHGDRGVDTIAACFDLRRRRGCPLEKLSLEDCINILPSNVARLNRFIDVDWDGRVLTSTGPLDSPRELSLNYESEEEI